MLNFGYTKQDGVQYAVQKEKSRLKNGGDDILTLTMKRNDMQREFMVYGNRMMLTVDC